MTFLAQMVRAATSSAHQLATHDELGGIDRRIHLQLHKCVETNLEPSFY